MLKHGQKCQLDDATGWECVEICRHKFVNIMFHCTVFQVSIRKKVYYCYFIQVNLVTLSYSAFFSVMVWPLPFY